MRYGYARVSTSRQNLARQIKKLNEQGVDSKNIYREKYTGTKMGRPIWDKLRSKLKRGDVVVFEDVSRFSRDKAEEAWKVYLELYESGIELEFISCPILNTAEYKKTVNNISNKEGMKASDKRMLEGVESFSIAFIEAQFLRMFEQANQEVVNIRKNVEQGLATTNKKLGRPKKGEEIGGRGMTLKQEVCVNYLRKYFEDVQTGARNLLPDDELIAILRNKIIGGNSEIRTKTLSRNSFYKYKNIALGRNTRSYTMTDEHRTNLQKHLKSL